jgi:hypothetical protein
MPDVRSCLMLAMVVACGDGQPEDPVAAPPTDPQAVSPSRTETVYYANQGTVCMSPGPDGETTIQVLVDGCASFCAELEASCSATLLGGTIELTSQGTATVANAQLDCPTACAVVHSRCTLPSVPPGAYVLQHGEMTANIDLPLSSPQTQFTGALPGEQTPCELVPVSP